MSKGRGWVVVGLLVAGCYTLQPAAGGVPQVGTKVAFDVNDVGRVGLGGSMGPEIAQVEGRLLEKDSSGYLLAVTAIRLLRGGEQPWSGEQVRVKSEYVGPVAYERRVSVGRSIAFGAIGIGGFGAILLTRQILGSGTRNPPPCCDSTPARLGRP